VPTFSADYICGFREIIAKQNRR